MCGYIISPAIRRMTPGKFEKIIFIACSAQTGFNERKESPAVVDGGDLK
jgi:hypothetical protein